MKYSTKYLFSKIFYYHNSSMSIIQYNDDKYNKKLYSERSNISLKCRSVKPTLFDRYLKKLKKGRMADHS